MATTEEKKAYILKNTMLVLSKTDGYYNSLFGVEYYHKATYNLYLLLLVDIFLVVLYCIAIWNHPQSDNAAYILVSLCAVNLLCYSTMAIIKNKKAKIMQYGKELYGEKYNIYEIFQLTQRETHENNNRK